MCFLLRIEKTKSSNFFIIVSIYQRPQSIKKVNKTQTTIRKTYHESDAHITFISMQRQIIAYGSQISKNVHLAVIESSSRLGDSYVHRVVPWARAIDSLTGVDLL